MRERAGRSAGDDVDVDHIIDLQLGGTDELGNMRLLNRGLECQLTNQKRNSETNAGE